MADDEIREAEVYLVIKKAAWRYDPPIITAMRKTKPTVQGGEIAVKVIVRIPMKLFAEYIPVATVEITERNVIGPEVILAIEEGTDEPR